MPTIIIILFLIFLTPAFAALAFEIYDWKTGNHPFQHRTKK